jgi:radical SAM protein with 4Fe4S-binding SPASM domain
LKNENYEDIEFVTTLMKTNCQHIEEIITYSINAKVKKITFLTLAKQGRANELWDQISLSADEVEKIFIEIYKYRNKYRKEILIEGSPWSNYLLRMLFGGGSFNFNCDIVSFPRIDSHGRVYPCPFFDGNTYLGILFKNSLSKILYNKKSKNYKKAVLERKEKIENCRNCKWKDICGSGCMADAYFFSGTIWDKSAHCKPLSSFYAYLNKEMKLNK